MNIQNYEIDFAEIGLYVIFLEANLFFYNNTISNLFAINDTICKNSNECFAAVLNGNIIVDTLKASSAVFIFQSTKFYSVKKGLGVLAMFGNFSFHNIDANDYIFYISLIIVGNSPESEFNGIIFSASYFHVSYIFVSSKRRREKKNYFFYF